MVMLMLLTVTEICRARGSSGGEQRSFAKIVPSREQPSCIARCRFPQTNAVRVMHVLTARPGDARRARHLFVESLTMTTAQASSR